MATYQLWFTVENGRTPVFEYTRSQLRYWRISGENEAVAIVRLLEEIERTGPQGTVETIGTMTFFIASEGKHRIAHAPHPAHPQVILALTAFDQSDFTQGRDRAWQLLQKALGLIP